MSLWLAGCQATALPVASPAFRTDSLHLAPSDEASEVSTTLSVRLDVRSRSIQALPATWDTATLNLQHASRLTQPLTATLTKGMQLVANGSGGYVANGVLGGRLRPTSGYVLTVSLWNGAAGGTLVGEKQITLSLAAGANAVTVPIEVYPTLGLNAPAPNYAFPGDSLTLTGQAFSVLSSLDQLTLGGTAATVTAASSTSLSTTVPSLAQSSATWQLQVGSSLVARTAFNLLGCIGTPTSWVSLPSTQASPSIADGPGEYMMVWEDTRNGAPAIYGKRISTSGSALSSDLAIASFSGSQSAPAIAYNPGASQYLVVYQDAANAGDIVGQLVNANGTLSAASISINVGGGAQVRPQLAYNPVSNEFAVGWTDSRSGTQDIYVARVSPSGTILASSLGVATGVGNQSNCSVAVETATGNWIMTWEDDSTGVRKIQGLIATSAPALVAGPFEISPAPTVDQVDSRAAYDSTTGDFFVVWVSRTAPYQIVGQRVTKTGTLVGSPVVISNATGTKSTPRLSYQAHHQKFLVSWTDTRSGNPDLYGQYVGTDGTLWGSNFVVAGGNGSEGPCDVATDPGAKLSMSAFQTSSNGGDLFGQLLR